MTTTELPIEPARALHLQPGDLLVFRLTKLLSRDESLSLENYLHKRLPEGVNHLVLDACIELDPIHSVIQQKDLQP